MPGGRGAVKDPEATRRKLLEAAFDEFYTNGFQGGSINHIVEEAGTTKGALFHHFGSKQALGYAVVDELIGPLLLSRWLEPLASTDNPIYAMSETFERLAEEDIASGNWLKGCPLNNLAQEMSPLDSGFQERITHLYDTWRAGYTGALERGMAAGTVWAGAVPTEIASMLVASQMGIWGTGKGSRNAEVMRHAVNAVLYYLDTLRP